MIKIKHKGDFSRTRKYFTNVDKAVKKGILDKYGQAGVAALASATPVDTGLTAASWGYKIERTAVSSKIIFTNSNIQNGVPIAIILQYGHATGNGGWVEGRDYINPAIQPIFDAILEEACKEVRKA